VKNKNRFLQSLADREARYYEQIHLPDLLIVLKLDPELAVQRKTEETETSVRARSSEVWRLGWEKVSGFEVDASGSKEESVRAGHVHFVEASLKETLLKKAIAPRISRRPQRNFFKLRVLRALGGSKVFL
jgi:thymidylate kinase